MLGFCEVMNRDNGREHGDGLTLAQSSTNQVRIVCLARAPEVLYQRVLNFMHITA